MIELVTSPAYTYAILLFPVVAIGLALWLSHRRVKALREWCRRVGWTYRGHDRSLASRWRGTPFGTGHTRRVSHVVVGSFAGRQALSFEYSYRTGGGKNQSTFTFHVMAVAMPTYLPTLELTPGGLAARIATALGGQDIAFESAEFNRAWRVQARDVRFAHDIVHPRLMERLLRPDTPRAGYRIEGADILTWSSGAQRPEVIAARLGVLCAVLDSIPRYVWQDHGHDPGA